MPAATRATLITLLMREDPTLDPRRIVVAPLDNHTGDPSFDALGEMAADWIARGLTATGEVEVVDGRTALITSRIVERIPRLLREGDLAVALANEIGAGIVVSGKLYRMRDSVGAEVQMVDVSSGTLLRIVDPVAGLANAPSEFVGVLATRVVGALGVAIQTAPGGAASIAALRNPPSYDAYQETNRAWERYLLGDTADFFALTERVLAIDSTYVTPWAMRAQVLSFHGQWARLDSVLRRLDRVREQLTQAERIGLEAYEAELRGDLEGKLRAAQELIGAVPASAEVPLLAASVAVRGLNRPRDGLKALAHTHPERGLNIVSPAYWQEHSTALPELRQYEAELERVGRGLRQFPGRWQLRWRRLRALAALGRLAEFERELPGCQANDHRVAVACRFFALKELRTHGHAETARRLLEDTIEEFRNALADTRHGPWLVANLLYEAGRWSQLRTMAETLIARDSTDVNAVGFLGVVAARLGDRVTAERAARSLAELKHPFLMGRHTFWEAKIAAVLGERDGAVELLRRCVHPGAAFLGSARYRGALSKHPIGRRRAH